jgi:hypothetical protein
MARLSVDEYNRPYGRKSESVVFLSVRHPIKSKVALGFFLSEVVVVCEFSPSNTTIAFLLDDANQRATIAKKTCNEHGCPPLGRMERE